MKPAAAARQNWKMSGAGTQEEFRTESRIASRAPEADDPLGAAQGLVFALLLVVPFWALVLALVLYLTR